LSLLAWPARARSSADRNCRSPPDTRTVRVSALPRPTVGQRIPDATEYLDDIELNGLGGTCYSNNYYLYLLLEALGYDVALCGADMSPGRAHREYREVAWAQCVVDGGYAPF
jgi:hypothetical protein